MKSTLLEAIVSAQAARRPVATVTRLADGTQALWQEAGLCGELELPSAAAEEIARRIVADRSGLLEADEGLFLRVYVPVPRLLVVGAVHIAQALAPMAATAGFAVVVIDPRRAFASSARFPGVLLRHEWPDQALAELRPDAATAVVSLTHDPKLDDPALAAALTSAAFYIGSLGSTRTHARRLERLREQGFDDATLARIHAPVGLDLGGRMPAEISVAILAEIVQVRYRGGA